MMIADTNFTQTAKQRSEIKQLCELKSSRNAAWIALEWASIIVVVLGTQRLFNPVTYGLSVLWIGSRYHALAILMHEAAHFRLFKNRFLNECIGELFLAWPITFTLSGYRNTHLTHHRFLNSPDDPDWDTSRADYVFPKTKMQMFWSLIANGIGIGFYKEFAHTAQSSTQFNVTPRWLRISQACFYATVVICSIALSFWKILILYWLIPAATSLILIAYIRSVAEHYGLSYAHTLNDSRNTIAPLWERILIAPYNVGYHLDHHLHPGVPWYNLKRLHAVLSEDEQYCANAHNTEEGYVFGVLRECTAQPD